VTSDPNVHPAWAQETKQVAADLDLLDYFQILGCAPETPLHEMKAQYHQLQKNYHPDAFFGSPDRELRTAVLKISKRVSEAYVILRDPQKRARYIKDISGPDREKKLRYTDESEQELRRERLHETGKTPQGQKLFKKASDAMKTGDWASAERDLRTALIFEPDSELFKSTLEQVRAKLNPPAAD
jgi:curved DNA-binding protein CbpA